MWGGGGDTPIHMLYGDVPHFSFFFLIILFIFSIQDSLQADLEFKLQSIASYRKTLEKKTTGCKIINRTYKYQKYSVIAVSQISKGDHLSIRDIFLLYLMQE